LAARHDSPSGASIRMFPTPMKVAPLGGPRLSQAIDKDKRPAKARFVDHPLGKASPMTTRSHPNPVVIGYATKCRCNVASGVLSKSRIGRSAGKAAVGSTPASEMCTAKGLVGAQRSHLGERAILKFMDRAALSSCLILALGML
jgi:hypothetical protein